MTDQELAEIAERSRLAKPESDSHSLWHVAESMKDVPALLAEVGRLKAEALTLHEQFCAIQKQRDAAWSEVERIKAIARRCWQGWSLSADLGHPPGTSQGVRAAERLADQEPWLREKER